MQGKTENSRQQTARIGLRIGEGKNKVSRGYPFDSIRAIA